MSHIESRILFESLLFPPGIIILLVVLVLMTATIRPRGFERLLIVAVLLLWLFSVPAFSLWLMAGLQGEYPRLEKVPADADVIVLLGAGQSPGVSEYGRKGQLAPRALERVRYAAFLAHRSGLPVVVSGGSPEPGEPPQAVLMRRVLEDEFGVAQALTETRSTTTYENGAFTLRLLRQHHFKHPVLVTHAWHMPRAVAVFRHLGVSVYPAPTGWVRPGRTERGYYAWFPRADMLEQSVMALHEYVGRLYYWYKYFRHSGSGVRLALLRYEVLLTTALDGRSRDAVRNAG